MRPAWSQAKFAGIPTRTDSSGSRLAGLANGRLLRAIVGHFDVFITVDKSIQFQQNLYQYLLGFVLLRAISNDITDIQPLVSKLMDRLADVVPGRLLIIE